MLRAFLYLVATSGRNRLRRQIRRLRSPRYVIALVAGVGYIWWFLVRPAHQGGASALAGDRWTMRLGALGFALMTAKWWVSGADERALAFTPAEIHLLFPAPVTRRMLVLTKLLRAQIVVLVNTIVWSVILRGEGLHLAAWRRAGGLWILFSTLHLHRLGAALATASLARHGRSGRRQWIPIVVVAAAAAALGWSIYQAGPVLERAWRFGIAAVFQVLGRQLETPPARWVLAPFRALLAPALAPDVGTWARTIPAALGLLALHVVWVLWTDVAFEEAAIEASERRAARRGRGPTKDAARTPAELTATQARRRPARLSPDGVPALGIVWKNLLSAWRSGIIARHLTLLGIVSAAAAVFASRDERIAEVALVVAGVWGGILVVAGPLWVRFDLRADLPNIAILRTWPLRGRDLVAAQVASSALALTVFQLVLLAGLLALTFMGDVIPVPTANRFALASAVALALPGVNAAALTIQNAVTLLFPAWIRLGTGTRGVEAMGQSLVSMAGSVALLAVLLLPPAALAAGVAYVLRPHVAAWAFAPGAALGSAVALVELVPVMAWLGRVFERTEPSAIT